jgi:RHS repeat-associated protein
MKSLAAIASGQGCMSGLLLLFLIFGGISKAAEAATFNYTGPAFSIPECAGQFTPSSICIGGNIAVSVTIPDSVVASGQANANQITSWSISAAGVTLSSSGGNYLLANSTGFVFSNGLPATWEFAAATNNATFVELISEGGDEITTNWTGAAGEDEFLAGSTNGTYTYSAVGIVYTTQPGTWTLVGAALGDCSCNATPGSPQVGLPITVGTGNMFEQVTDYTTAGQNPLSFTRYYNSLASTDPYAPELGSNWRSNFDRYLNITSATSVMVERADGQVLPFTSTGGVWSSLSDVDINLTNSGLTWVLTDHNDTVETYTQLSSGEGMLNSIALRNGYTQSLAYNSNRLESVTDSYGRKLGFSYASNGMLETVTTPDSLVVTYGFTAATGGNQLTSVSYNTDPVTSQTYVYENSALPFALTGIIDENNSRFATWTYNSLGQGLTSQHGTGNSTADLTTLTYNSNATTTVTNALGVTDTYTFTTLQGVPKVTQISRAATSATSAATQTFTYDSNGYLASKTDWNGNQTTFVNDTHGDPTTMSEAVGTSAARTTTIAYDSTWVHLPDSITTPGLTTSVTYDSNGEQLTKTLIDTTTATAPYSTNGQTRTWTNTWSNYLLASAQTPNGNTTKYGYDSTGALTSTTDALKHVTQITAHTGGGLPETIVDPNNVTTTLTYDPRLRLTSSTVSGSSGTYKTTWTYDAAGNLITTTLPDNSYLTNTYDTAHRLIKVTDALGNYTGYTLDALGDRTQTSVYKSGGTITWQDSGTFDALGRELVDTAGAGQTTTRTYDPNGNVHTVEDGLNHTTTNTYDALNRLSTSTDANAGVTTPSYDTHDRIISVADANSNTTVYIRDGFGEVIQQTSPDSGVAVLHYDTDANLTSKTDALGIVTIQTFDALDRPLTTTYPADTAENVAYTYDQTGTGFSFGVGRLTSATDAAGSLTRAYEDRGNLSAEVRTNGNTTLTTGYTYDGANRVASMTYPDGTLVTYRHDAAGYLASVSAKPSGATATTTIATLSHQPFGPQSAVTYGNGIAETWAYDNSYRATNITDALSSANLQDLTYAYDNANNVKSIADAVNAANDQTLGYDVINRLTSAASGTGGYGSLSWTYDRVGNRLTQVEGATTASYGYATGTNRLSSITTSTAMALLNALPKMRPRNGTGLMFFAHAPPNVSQTPRRPQPPNLVLRSSQILAGFLGWPLLVAGFAGVIRFRKRLRSHRLLVVLSLLALLTGIGRLLNGCGGGSTGSSTQTPTASTPTFSPAGGTYTAAQSVTISDVTTGATIYYTTDGSTPTTNSTKFSGAIMVPATETINAIAIASGYTNSTIATATYTITIPQAATPTFSPVAGTYTAVQTVTISDAITGASIYYTTDGTTPTTSSTLYTKSITVSVSQTINAIAVASGYTNSAVGTAAYTINIPMTVATPTFSPVVGTYSSAQTVSISDSTAGATIYYTTNSTTPTTGSTMYTGAFAVSSTETIEAIAVASGYTNSAVATATYTINVPVAATPTFAPGTGTYTAAQTVTISDATAGAAIYYTTDGTTPKPSSTPYSSPITVSSTETIEAIATASGDANSAIATATYTINISSGGSVTVITNANGNITSIPPADSTDYATFTYNNANRLASVTGSPLAATFTYDWAGQRFSKTDNGETPSIYSYAQDGTLIAENDGGTTTDYIYADGRPIAILQPSATIAADQENYVVADHLATPELVINSSGSTVWSTTYQPFGSTGLINASISQNLRFPGQYADVETGFSYNLNRDYMPNLGRYLESDPIGLSGGTNTYSYVGGNPIRSIDRLGLQQDTLNNLYLQLTSGASSAWAQITCTAKEATKKVELLIDYIPEAIKNTTLNTTNAEINQVYGTPDQQSGAAADAAIQLEKQKFQLGTTDLESI